MKAERPREREREREREKEKTRRKRERESGITTDRARRMNPIDGGQDSGQSFPKESSFRSYRKLASKSFVDKWATEGLDRNLFSPRVLAR